MQAPAFWYRPPSWQSALLAPLALAYGAIAADRARGAPRLRAPMPVICVGNVVAGGAGKTPMVRYLAERLQGRGVAVAILSRGYGGSARGPRPVQADRDCSALVGDEPLMLARAGLPVWVGRDRAAAATAIAAEGRAQAIVMDDGLQNPSLAKDLSLLVIDGATGFGNRALIPAGPLREPLATALARVDLAVLLGDDQTGAGAALMGQVPVLAGRIRPLADPTLPPGARVFGFAGIARPGKLRDSLVALKLDVAGFLGFADHHRYSDADLAQLRAASAASGARLVTTEKDWVRLPDAMRAQVQAVRVTVELDRPSLLDDRLAALLARRTAA